MFSPLENKRMASINRKLEFYFESNSPPVDQSALEDAMMVYNDPTSTIKEKILARCIIKTIAAHNATVASMETGTVVVKADINNVKGL